VVVVFLRKKVLRMMRGGAARFEVGERFIIAAAVEIVPEAFIELRAVFFRPGHDLLRDSAQSLKMRGGITITPGMVGDDCAPMAQGAGKRI
jgi:hypothetical protein